MFSWSVKAIYGHAVMSPNGKAKGGLGVGGGGGGGLSLLSLTKWDCCSSLVPILIMVH